MKSSPQQNFSKKWAIACFCYLAVLLGIVFLANLGMLPVRELAKIPHYDTIGHFFLYGIASYLSHRALAKRAIAIIGYPFPLGPTIFSIFTILEELLQQILPHRTFSLLDLSASLLGIIVFYGIGEFLGQRMKDEG